MTEILLEPAPEVFDPPSETVDDEPVSLVIPVLNERESLAAATPRSPTWPRANGLDVEVVFVDDGSTRRLVGRHRRAGRASDPRVRGIRFRRNFGKAAALSAGFSAARGDIILTLDADLQDDPPRSRASSRRCDDGLDVVSGWKKVRHDPWHKVWPSRVFNGMVELADRRAAARPQLRHEVLPRRGLPRGAAVRRAAPLHPGAGGGARLPASARSRSTIGRASSATRSTACAASSRASSIC